MEEKTAKAKFTYNEKKSENNTIIILLKKINKNLLKNLPNRTQ